MPTSNPTVMVTGASGFIGSHAAVWPFAASTRLHLVSYRSTSYPGAFAAGELGDATRDTCDLTQAESVHRLVAGVRPDQVWNCAGITDERDPAALIRLNMHGAFLLCEELHRLDRPCRALFLGSAAEYGAAARPDRAMDEGTLPLPVTIYGASKLAAWQIAASYATRSLLVPCGARLFNVIGSGQPKSTLASSVARQIALIERGRQAPIVSVGSTAGQRDYVDINDAVEACSLILERGRSGVVYNVCSGQPTATGDVIDALLGMAQAPVRLQTGITPVQRGGIDVIWGDNNLIQTELNWWPRTPLIDSLSSLLAWWRLRVDQEFPE